MFSMRISLICFLLLCSFPEYFFNALFFRHSIPEHFQSKFFSQGFLKIFPRHNFFVTVLQHIFHCIVSLTFCQKILQSVVFLSQFSIRCFQCVVFPVTVFQKICCNIIQILHRWAWCLVPLLVLEHSFALCKFYSYYNCYSISSITCIWSISAIHCRFQDYINIYPSCMVLCYCNIVQIWHCCCPFLFVFALVCVYVFVFV